MHSPRCVDDILPVSEMVHANDDEEIPSATLLATSSLHASPEVGRVRKTIASLTAISCTACLLVFTVVVTFSITVYFSIRALIDGVSVESVAYISALVTVLMAVIISSYEIFMHLTHYYQPHLQRYVVRIIIMVPVYAISSYCALYLRHNALSIDTIKDFYEAFTIYSFTYFVLSYCEQVASKSVSLFITRGPRLPFAPWRLGSHFIYKVKQGCLQYVAVRLFFAIVVFILESRGKYVCGYGLFVWSKAYTYVTFAVGFSQMWAMYSLVMFYRCCKEELQPIEPFYKFLCVKLVVFFSFWQSCIIRLLMEVGVVHSTQSFNWSTNEVGRGLADFLICVEMAFAAVGHHFCFSYKEYVPDEIQHQDTSVRFRNLYNAMWHSVVPTDVLHDVRDEILIGRKDSLYKQHNKQKKYSFDENGETKKRTRKKKTGKKNIKQNRAQKEIPSELTGTHFI
eukprot:GSMAST32.ASY1.ANO1.2810.1 assembled CDS